MEEGPEELRPPADSHWYFHVRSQRGRLEAPPPTDCLCLTATHAYNDTIPRFLMHRNYQRTNYIGFNRLSLKLQSKTQSSAWIYLPLTPNAGIKGMLHHTWLWLCVVIHPKNQHQIPFQILQIKNALLYIQVHSNQVMQSCLNNVKIMYVNS